tara:strand:- start:1683 stop:1967 length:285 start_codon:yes stop_codon:yes gene_type:complete
MSKNKDGDEMLRAQIDALIRDEIQEGINDYIDDTEKAAAEGFGITKHGDEKLKVKVSNNEVEKLIREYKKLKRKEKSNLNQIKLLDQHGRHLKN